MDTSVYTCRVSKIINHNMKVHRTLKRTLQGTSLMPLESVIITGNASDKRMDSSVYISYASRINYHNRETHQTLECTLQGGSPGSLENLIIKHKHIEL